MKQSMNPNSCPGRPAQPPPMMNNSWCNPTDKNMYCYKKPSCPDKYPCCDDFQKSNVGNCESECKVVRVNLKECAAKLWNNLFGNFNEDQTDYYGNRDTEPFSTDTGCNYGWKSTGEELVGRKAVRSRSESSKYDHNKPSIDMAKANRMKVAFKCCMQEKLSKLKICESFLLEVQQMLSKYPYTDVYFYWELMQAIQAEVEEHKCKNISKSEREDKKLRQLYMLSYAISRFILQLEYITGGSTFSQFKRSKSWNQVLNQLKDDFRNPKTGQFSINPFPKLANSFKQGETDQKKLCSCLPLGFFSRALGKNAAEGQNECISLKVEPFPDEFTCYDIESLNYLLETLQYDLQLECSKGVTGKCQVANCPYPVPIRDERVIKELKTNIHVTKQLICYLQRMTCFNAKPLPPPRTACEPAPIPPHITNTVSTCTDNESHLAKRRSKSILKNKCTTMDGVCENRGSCNVQVKCSPVPKQTLPPSIKCNFSSSPRNISLPPQNFEDKNLRSGLKTPCISSSESPKLHVKKISQIPPPKVTEQSTIVNLCCPEPEKLKRKRRRSISGTRRTKSGGGSSVCCSEDVCKKCNKLNVSCPICKERKEERRRRRREVSDNVICDKAFCDKTPEVVRRKEKEALMCKTINFNQNNLTNPTSQFCPNKNENVLVICSNPECDTKNTNLIHSLSKMMRTEAKKSQSKCGELGPSIDAKTLKCAEKLRKASNIQINDCKHKKERIIRLVNLLSNNDCSFKPTDCTNPPITITNSCKGPTSRLEEVSELYEKFLALEAEENCKKPNDNCDNQPTCSDDQKTITVVAEVDKDDDSCGTPFIPCIKSTNSNSHCSKGSDDFCEPTGSTGTNSSRGSNKSDSLSRSCFTPNFASLAQRNSIGVQASGKVSKQSVGLSPECRQPSKASVGCNPICPPSKHSVGTSTLFNPPSRSMMSKPSPTSIGSVIKNTLSDISLKLRPRKSDAAMRARKKKSEGAMRFTQSKKSKTEIFMPTKRSKNEVRVPSKKSRNEIVIVPTNRSRNEICVPTKRSRNEVCVPTNRSRNEVCVPSNRSKNEICIPSNRSRNEVCIPTNRSRSEMVCVSSKKSKNEVFVPTKVSKNEMNVPTKKSKSFLPTKKSKSFLPKKKSKSFLPTKKSKKDVRVQAKKSANLRSRSKKSGHALRPMPKRSESLLRAHMKRSESLICPRPMKSESLPCSQTKKIEITVKRPSYDVICKNTKAFKAASSRSMECLKQKLECKYRALTRKQEQQYKKQKRLVAKKINKRCKKCISAKSVKSKTSLKSCKSKASMNPPKSQCSLKSLKSKCCLKRKSQCSVKSRKSICSLNRRSKCSLKSRRSKNSLRSRRSKSSLRSRRSKSSLKGRRSRSGMKSRRSRSSVRSRRSRCSLKKKRSIRRLRSRCSMRCKKKNCKKCKEIRSKSCTALLANIATKVDPCYAYELAEEMNKQKCKRKQKGCASSKCKVKKRSKSKMKMKKSSSKSRKCKPKKLTCEENEEQLEQCTSALLENLTFTPTRCTTNCTRI